MSWQTILEIYLWVGLIHLLFVVLFARSEQPAKLSTVLLILFLYPVFFLLYILRRAR